MTYVEQLDYIIAQDGDCYQIAKRIGCPACYLYYRNCPLLKIKHAPITSKHREQLKELAMQLGKLDFLDKLK
jgi:hypothetical protein